MNIKTLEERTSWMVKPRDHYNDPSDKKVIDTAQQSVVFRFGYHPQMAHPVLKDNYTPDLLNLKRVDEDEYEFWCKLIWCVTCKLKPLEEGKSYKLAVLRLCKGEYDNG